MQNAKCKMQNAKCKMKNPPNRGNLVRQLEDEICLSRADEPIAPLWEIAEPKASLREVFKLSSQRLPFGKLSSQRLPFGKFSNCRIFTNDMHPHSSTVPGPSEPAQSHHGHSHGLRYDVKYKLTRP